MRSSVHVKSVCVMYLVYVSPLNIVYVYGQCTLHIHILYTEITK